MMEDMPKGRHELDEPAPAVTPGEPPGRRHDHIWVLFLIAACALAEVFGSWLGIASVSGFPHYGPVTTGWVLFATTEGFWGYALWSWLAGAPGPRSRRFAMTSAIVMFVLSFVGQEAGHLVATDGRAAPWYVVAIVTPLPLVAVGLIAILIHLRQADREAAEAAWRKAEAAAEAAAIERAEADERAWLRRELDAANSSRVAEMTALREELAGELDARDRSLAEAAAALEDARSEAASATARADRLERKLAGPAGRSKAGTGRRGTAPRTGTATDGRTGPEDDLELEAKALKLLATNLDMSGAELARKLNVSEGYGRKLRRRLTMTGPSEAVPDRPEDRAGTAGADRSEDRS